MESLAIITVPPWSLTIGRRGRVSAPTRRAKRAGAVGSRAARGCSGPSARMTDKSHQTLHEHDRCVLHQIFSRRSGVVKRAHARNAALIRTCSLCFPQAFIDEVSSSWRANFLCNRLLQAGQSSLQDADGRIVPKIRAPHTLVCALLPARHSFRGRRCLRSGLIGRSGLNTGRRSWGRLAESQTHAGEQDCRRTCH